jgi:hypothetical protein
MYIFNGSLVKHKYFFSWSRLFNFNSFFIFTEHGKVQNVSCFERFVFALRKNVFRHWTWKKDNMERSQAENLSYSC